MNESNTTPPATSSHRDADTAPGPGLRHAIGVEIMGWRAVDAEPDEDVGTVVTLRQGECLRGEPCNVDGRGFFGYAFEAWRPDEWISNAMEVVEKLKAGDFWPSMTYKSGPLVTGGTLRPAWLARFRCVRGGTRGDHYAADESLALAICRAALSTLAERSS